MYGEIMMVGLMIAVSVASLIFATAMVVETIWLEGRSERKSVELRAGAVRG